MRVGFLLQHSPQDSLGFESFFKRCAAAMEEKSTFWVFLRGDGVYQGLKDQRLDEPGFQVPVDGGWNALRARGLEIYVNQRCAAMRGMATDEFFVEGSKLVNLESFAELCLTSDRIEVL